MIERFHGIDRHKAMIYGDTSRSSERLTRLVLEASCGAFWWADRIEEQSAQCHVLNPHRFRIIKDSWNKTDRQDARNMAKALWVYLVTDEFGIPTVHKPTLVVRELRKLFSGYDLINRQLRTLKNSIQAALVDEGVVLSSRGKSVYGHRREPFGVRGCLSYDKENSWDYENEIIIRDDLVKRVIGYPTSILLPSGTVFTVYWNEDAEGVTSIVGSYYKV